MKRTLLVFASFVVAFAVARGQDQKKPDTPAPATERTDIPKKDAGPKAPDPSKAAPAGEVLASGSVKRENLYPLDEGRTWRYELKTWLATSAPEEGTPEEAEPPRTHHMSVAVGAPAKIEGKEARCLEWRLDEADAQRAYYIQDEKGVFCVQRRLGTGDRAHEYTLTPPQPVLQGDLVVGAKWTWEGTVGPSKGKQSYEVLREEKIKAAGQEFPTVVVRMTYTGDDESNGVSVKWLSPGVGLVREETEVKADQQIYRTLAVLTKFDTAKK